MSSTNSGAKFDKKKKSKIYVKFESVRTLANGNSYKKGKNNHFPFTQSWYKRVIVIS